MLHQDSVKNVVPMPNILGCCHMGLFNITSPNSQVDNFSGKQLPKRRLF